MKIYKSTRAKEAICNEVEKFVKFGKDENGYFLITSHEVDGKTREYRLSFSEDVIIIKSVSVGNLQFVATETDTSITIING